MYVSRTYDLVHNAAGERLLLQKRIKYIKIHHTYATYIYYVICPAILNLFSQFLFFNLRGILLGVFMREPLNLGRFPNVNNISDIFKHLTKYNYLLILQFKNVMLKYRKTLSAFWKTICCLALNTYVLTHSPPACPCLWQAVVKVTRCMQKSIYLNFPFPPTCFECMSL